jgi:hypothetical protein
MTRNRDCSQASRITRQRERKGGGSAKDRIHSGNYFTPLEYTAYYQGNKKKVLQGYKSVLGVRGLGVFSAYGAGRISLSGRGLADL